MEMGRGTWVGSLGAGRTCSVTERHSTWETGEMRRQKDPCKRCPVHKSAGGSGGRGGLVNQRLEAKSRQPHSPAEDGVVGIQVNDGPGASQGASPAGDPGPRPYQKESRGGTIVKR